MASAGPARTPRRGRGVARRAHAVELERHVPRRAVPRRRRGPGRLQAGARRAAPVGLPAGLHRREIAAYVLSEALGWGLVPPTVLRDDGPLGEGSLQLFVPADFEQHYFTLHERGETHDALMTIARLRPPRQQRRPQERPLPARPATADLRDRQRPLLPRRAEAAHGDLGVRRRAASRRRSSSTSLGIAQACRRGCAALLDRDEVDAVQRRAKAVVAKPVFPVDPSGRRYPWPMV